MQLLPFITENEIKEMNKKLGVQISNDYSKILGLNEELIVIVTLRGALYFAADLTREITVPLTQTLVAPTIL